MGNEKISKMNCKNVRNYIGEFVTGKFETYLKDSIHDNYLLSKMSIEKRNRPYCCIVVIN